MGHEERLAEHERRKAKALAMGSPRKLAEIRAAGHLNARERIDRLVEPGSFVECGLFAVSARPEDAERTPTDGFIIGTGVVDGRLAAVAASDYTTMGSSTASINNRKWSAINRLAHDQGLPLLIMGECSGARMPDYMGAQGIASGGPSYMRDRSNPWISAVLGQSFGGSSWKAAMSDLVIQRKGAIMAVSSGQVTEVAISEKVDPEALGGWNLRSAVTGETDLVVESDLAAIGAMKRYLSYLPDHNMAVPGRIAVPAGSEEGGAGLLDIVPAERSKVYDVRKVIEAVVDKGSFTPVKERFAKVAVTGFARIDGWSVGVLASNPMFKGGALDPDACRKMISFIVLCDSFNLPMVFLCDTPGFLVGVEGERQGLAGKIMNFIQALEMSTVPKFAVILRKSYGQAYFNMGGKHDEIAAWMGADVSFMDPDVGVNVVYGVRHRDDPVRFKELRDKLSRGTSAYDLAAGFHAGYVLDPRETRGWLKRQLAVYRRRTSGGIGEHRLRHWPAAL